jgi:hypothetical protein
MSAGPARRPGRDNDPARHGGDRPDTTPGTFPASASASGPAPTSGPGRADDGPLPAASLAGWVPLPASSQDWLDEAEWAASRVACEDEQEPVDPELEDGPPDWEGLDAVIAEAREITAAEARDAEYASRMVADGGFGLVGAAPGPRGPGQPGSAKSFAGEHASPAAAFGSGLVLDTAPGCITLAQFADAVAGPEDRYPGATDDEIVGVICALDRVESHVAARKLAAVAEFTRRRPSQDQETDASRAPQEGPRKNTPQECQCKGTAQDSPEGPRKNAPQDPAQGGTENRAAKSPLAGGAAEGCALHSAAGSDAQNASPESPGKDGGDSPRNGSPADSPAKGAADSPEQGAADSPEQGAARMPEGWDEFAVKELAWALAESLGATEKLMAIADHLEARLPGTKAALRDGQISLAKATIIATATQFLDAKESAAAESMVLGRAGRLTPPGLRAAIARAVMEVAPKKALKRREEAAAKLTRVERWAEDTGNAALAGRELPSAQVLAADQRITAWARQLRAAGLDGDMDVLRARAYMDLLLGMDSRLTVGAAGRSGAGRDGQDRPGDRANGGSGSSGPDGGPADAGHRPGGPADAGDWADGPADVGDWPGGLSDSPGPGPGAALLPPGFCGQINLTVPLVTALGLADRPGQAGTLGPVDPWLARDLVRSAARNPRTTWCVTVTDEHGHAIGHGCARPEPRTRTTRPAARGAPHPPGGHDPPGPPGPAGDAGSPRFSFTAAGQHGPPGGYGTWRLATGTPGQPDLIIAVHPVATEDCDHRFQAAGHDPGVMLRHLTQIRHATCTAPGCRRPAATCDFEHNTPYEAGGRTCMCNCSPKCRGDHRLKQDPRWKVEQPTPATFRWTTPTGRVYTTEATRYPI